MGVACPRPVLESDHESLVLAGRIAGPVKQGGRHRVKLHSCSHRLQLLDRRREPRDDISFVGLRKETKLLHAIFQQHHEANDRLEIGIDPLGSIIPPRALVGQGL